MSFADDFEWTGAESAVWSNPNNWLHDGGDPDAYPRVTDSIFFNADTSIERSTSSSTTQKARNMTIANGVSVQLLGWAIHIEDGTIDNKGTLIVTNDGIITEMDVRDTVNLIGGGTLVLQEAGNSRIYGGGMVAAPTQLINVDNTIRGQGWLRVDVVNQSLIRAEGNTLQFHNLDNTSGRIEVASDGNITVGDNVTGAERVIGGTIHFESGGTIESRGYYQDVTITGDALIDGRATFENTLTNRGTISLFSTVSNTGSLFMLGNARIEGGGTIVMDNDRFGGASIRTTSGDTIVNVDNTIRGHGIMSAIINQSLIRVEGGSLSFGSIENSLGRVEIASDGQLQSRVAGGTIHGEAGGILSTLITDVTLTGDLGANFYGPAFQGTINNQAHFTSTGGIGILGPTTLTGGGTIVLDNTGDNDARFELAFTTEIPESESRLINLDNTIRTERLGYIEMDFENHGTVIINDWFIRGEGDVTLHDTSVLQMNEVDQIRPILIVNGDLVIDGSYELNLLNPREEGHERQIATAASITGMFDAVSVTGLADGLGYELIYGETSVNLRIVSEIIVGDLNGDGALTNSDISAFVLALTDPEDYATQFPDLTPDQVGDFNEDGIFTNADIAGFVAALTASPAAREARSLGQLRSLAVPEPSSLMLLFASGVLLLRRRRGLA